MITRRKFLGAAASVAALPYLPAGPDMILYNANVITMDRHNPRAEAIALFGDRIFKAGTNDEIRGMAKVFTTQIDLGGSTVVPGFIDAHSHPASSGRRHLRNVDCDLRSIDEIKQAIRARAEKTPQGGWVLGFKYDDTKTREGRPLSRTDLDEAAPYHPVFISHRGGHTAYVNSLAYQRVGISESVADPDGGMYGRLPDGMLSGKLMETATYPFREATAQEYTKEDEVEAVKLISKMMARTGVTSVTDAYGSPDDLNAYHAARQAGVLSLRVYCMIGYWAIDEMLAAGISTGLGDEWVRVGGMKLTADGSISERTARLSKPYIGSQNDYGIVVMEEEQLYAYALKAHQGNWQIGIHANGDIGIDIALNVYERLQKEHPRPDPRFRLEHCTMINPELIARIKALNAIPNPFSTYVYFHGEKMKYYGKERLESMFAVRSFLDAGINVTQTSDYPPGPFEP
ncbi:MAG: amidohydrolase, partial [Saprospiraceae bacterium]|nr:amidohydrolase [Saprospiraceae bacterium]